MKNSTILSLVLGVALAGYCQCAVMDSQSQSLMTKVFNYQGNLPPIKDDRTGETIRDDSEDNLETSTTSATQAENEAICWNLIVEQTAVTFALQNKVINELDKELEGLNLSVGLREAIEKVTKKLRRDMEDAAEALNNESPEEFFDALFDTSESIIQMSNLIRDPKLDEKVFLVLVKAVSRLGRNNSTLIQDFIDKCSLVNKSPQPRALPFF